jgi:hypothetical protein
MAVITEILTIAFITEIFTMAFITEFFVMAFIAEIFIMAFVTEIFSMAFITELFTMAFITEIWSGMLRRPKRCGTRDLTFQDPLGPLYSTFDWGIIMKAYFCRDPAIIDFGGLDGPGGRPDPQNR